MNIILVDDEQGALKLLQRHVTHCLPDADIHAFSTVDAVLSFAKENQIDIAFLDIRMPMMSGVELATHLTQLNEKINIIFTSGYTEYALDAMQMHSSGYILKPITLKDVQKELDHLRYPVTQKKPEVIVKTFGQFDVFVNGTVISFPRERAKEVLAYLVDRGGSSVTRKELASVLFEDKEYTRTTQTYLTQIINSLKEVLTKNGIDDLLVVDYNTYAIRYNEIKCDAYDYLKGVPVAQNLFYGEYMCQYSWAENSLYRFYRNTK